MIVKDFVKFGRILQSFVLFNMNIEGTQEKASIIKSSDRAIFFSLSLNSSQRFPVC